eukprot:9954017-Ditylum_brightwellii.AAC.1
MSDKHIDAKQFIHIINDAAELVQDIKIYTAIGSLGKYLQSLCYYMQNHQEHQLLHLQRDHAPIPLTELMQKLNRKNPQMSKKFGSRSPHRVPSRLLKSTDTVVYLILYETLTRSCSKM